MDKLVKMRILLMQEVKDSSLPKGGKILLLDMVAGNENLEETLDILESFEVIDEATKKRVKKWIPKMKKGALHKQLGIPEEEKIPAEKLVVKPGDSPKLKKRKILAKTLKKISKKRAKGEEEEG